MCSGIENPVALHDRLARVSAGHEGSDGDSVVVEDDDQPQQSTAWHDLTKELEIYQSVNRRDILASTDDQSLIYDENEEYVDGDAGQPSAKFSSYSTYGTTSESLRMSFGGETSTDPALDPWMASEPGTPDQHPSVLSANSRKSSYVDWDPRRSMHRPQPSSAAQQPVTRRQSSQRASQRKDSRRNPQYPPPDGRRMHKDQWQGGTHMRDQADLTSDWRSESGAPASHNNSRQGQRQSSSSQRQISPNRRQPASTQEQSSPTRWSSVHAQRQSAPAQRRSVRGQHQSEQAQNQSSGFFDKLTGGGSNRQRSISNASGAQLLPAVKDRIHAFQTRASDSNYDLGTVDCTMHTGY